MRSSCPNCGATVDIARIGKTMSTVVLEIAPDASTDATRYRVIEQNPLRVVPVQPEAPGAFQPDHTFDCPAFNNGRR